MRSYLDSYLNDELLTETNHDILQHIENCANCSVALKTRVHVKKLLQRAVFAETAPIALRERIQRDIRAHNRRFNFSAASAVFATAVEHRALLAASVLLILSLATWSVLSLRNQPQRLASVYENNSARLLSGQTRKVLDIGLSDHLECAIHNGFAASRFTFDEMARELGATYVGLVPLVKERVGADYEVVVGHHCMADGRQFVHLILRNKEKILSLVITGKNGESFSGSDQTIVSESSGVPLYQARLQNLEVAGFETKDYLAFVASDSRPQDNLQLAANVAPFVRDFLDKSGSIARSEDATHSSRHASLISAPGSFASSVNVKTFAGDSKL